MEFREFVEKDMEALRLDEARINFSKVTELMDKLLKTGKKFEGLYEDGVKVLAYVSHLKAAGGKAKLAADTLGVSLPTLQGNSDKNVLKAYNVPEELWKK